MVYRRVVTVSLIVPMLLTGCSVISPPLAVPQGDLVCHDATDRLDALWFGVPLTNTGPDQITLSEVGLHDSDGAVLLDALAFPEVVEADGTHWGFGTSRDPAIDDPRIWEVRQPVDGFVIGPGQNASVAFRITRAPNADVARVRGQTVNYRISGEPFVRAATSQLFIAIADRDCATFQE